MRNLSGHYGGGSPPVILTTHYDTRVVADREPDAEKRRLGSAGANDGGSGVGVLLEVARLIREHYQPQREIRLLFFDAEDNGDLEPWNSAGSHSGWAVGSSLYAAGLAARQKPVELLILVDMVGDSDQRIPMEGFSYVSTRLQTEALWSLATELGFEDQFPRRIGPSIIDDHLPFIQRGYPAVALIDLDYPYWHTTQDTIDKVSSASLERVGRLLQFFLERQGWIGRAP